MLNTFEGIVKKEKSYDFKPNELIKDKDVYDVNSQGMTKDLFIALKTKNSPVCILVDELYGFQRINNKADNKNIQTKNRQKYSETIFTETGRMFLLLDTDYFTLEDK